ncbi:hypothetical protein JTB14_004096 [Gonioctena quinquepunctata]|nr:hypothetical protein JTB14_004096 [Gonioctena quinquepunctata]
METRSNGLSIGNGTAKRARFYLRKVKNKETTPEMWIKWLKEDNKNADFVVEKLGKCSLSKIEAPINLMEKLQNVDYWPPGVTVRRFNFSLNNITNSNNITLDLVLTSMVEAEVTEADLSIDFMDEYHPPLEISSTLQKTVASDTEREYRRIYLHVEKGNILNWIEIFFCELKNL